MRKHILSILIAPLLMAGMIIVRADEEAKKSISAESLNTLAVIGKLGIPLGKVATVRATVVDGDSLGTKEDEGRYRLRIIEVNGLRLNSEPVVEFVLAPGSSVKLASNNLGLYNLKTGERAKHLDDAKIEELKKGYVGDAFLLQVYEMGRFIGIPDDMPSEVLKWQDFGFHFRTYIRVLREVDEK